MEATSVSENGNAVEQPQAPQSETAATLKTPHIVGFCGAAMAVCFFLPWITFFGATMSGFELAKDKDARMVWIIPALAVLTVFAGAKKFAVRIVAQFTGVAPFFLLVYAVHKQGKELLHLLGFGAYATLALGLVLLVIPRKRK